MMGTTYAFLVDVPYLFHDEKKIVCAKSLQDVIEWLEQHSKATGRVGRIDSIVNVGEVMNPVIHAT